MGPLHTKIVFVNHLPEYCPVMKRCGTHISENHCCTLFTLFFGQAWDRMCHKCQVWAEFGRFWPKIQFFWGDEVQLFIPSRQVTNETFVLKTLTSAAPIGC